MIYYDVAVPIKINTVLTYQYECEITNGTRVKISVGKRNYIGIVLNKNLNPAPDINYKSIIQVIDDYNIMSENMIKLANWICEYYKTPIGMVVDIMLPLSLNDNQKIKPKSVNYIKIINNFTLKETQKQIDALIYIQAKLHDKDEIEYHEIKNAVSYSMINTLKNKKIIEVITKNIEPEYIFPKNQSPKKVELNTEQIDAINSIIDSIEDGKYKTFLLYGVTGSGKTEVYIEAIKKGLTNNKSALILVPEISLTPQTVERFYHYFGREIAVLHSNLSDKERYFQYKKVAEGKISLVIGARSAIFAPLKNIGLIIVDEEHETSYKQENQPCYNARDVAVIRGSFEKATVILGSATPSLESWYNVLVEKYELIRLSQRPGVAIMPDVKIIDMRDEESGTWFSKELKEKIKDRLDKKEQVILFHNRRGYANFIQCEQCGKVFKCPDCDISLKYHLSHKIMKCHYCGYSENIIMKCDDCGSYNFVYGSPGTEQIEIKLQELFPSAKILRMDSDTTRKKDSYNAMFDAMKSHKIDILLGTQMISKGLDFHNVTLVGVISAEITLNIPDFRSAERTFQLLTQVAGRSGRGDKKGEVIIQARNPNHYALTQASKQDFINFSYQEIPLRNDTKYPPKFKLARVLFSCNDYDYLKKYLETCDIISLIKKLKFNKEEFIIFPFVEAPLPKIKTKFRFHFIIKSLKSSYIQRFLNAFLRVYSCPKNINMTIDVDPLTLL